MSAALFLRSSGVLVVSVAAVLGACQPAPSPPNEQVASASVAPSASPPLAVSAPAPVASSAVSAAASAEPDDRIANIRAAIHERCRLGHTFALAPKCLSDLPEEDARCSVSRSVSLDMNAKSREIRSLIAQIEDSPTRRMLEAEHVDGMKGKCKLDKPIVVPR